MKDNDMVALMLFNPEATMLDLDASGINIENTGIKDEQEYLKIDQVRNDPRFKDTNGNFSDKKFHEFYVDALKQYNILADGGWQPSFHENNIFAPAKLRRQGPDFQEVIVQNPFQRTMSFKDIGEWGPQTKSVREIAESLQVFNTETGEWMDSPETSFFGTVGMGPLVLATWDFDADKDGNPTNNKDEIVHEKGSYKLNDYGTFYYETLGNRSSHGKEILHYSDIITREDSNWNKIDFLDSDDIEKSVMGTVAKNVALVGSMFLPGGVGYAVTAATLLLQSLKLGATLGKIFLGSDSQAMNNLLAFASATDLHESTSDYAKNNLWSWENLVNTAGDAIGQLRQQRVLFEAVPWALGYGGLGKEKGLFTAKGQQALQEKLRSKYADLPINERGQSQNLLQALTDTQARAYYKEMRAATEANEITKNMTKVAAAVSKAYMTGITVNDMYDEAKEAGMSDFGAIAMTLGYAAAEYALLSTEIGEMILPELRAQRQQTKQLLKNATKVKTKDGSYKTSMEILNDAEKKATTPEEKKNFFWRAVRTGRKLWEDNRAGTASALTNAAIGALGEGVEEVTEEFLADAIKAMHDLGHWSQGEMLEKENAFDRYAMNFIGGFIGGGVNGLATDFSTFKRVAGLSSEESMKELIYKINNGEANEILDVIDKTKWASDDLSATKLVYDEREKKYVWQQAEDRKDSQNETIKTLLRNQIYSIINVLEASGAKVDEQGLFDALTLKQARFSMLANTSTAARYSETYTSRLLDLVNNYNEGILLDASLTDEQKRDKESEAYKTYERQKSELEKKRREIQKEIDEIKDGKLAARFIGTALLEIHPAVSQALITGPTIDLFVRRTHPQGKSFRDLNDLEKAEYIEKYKAYKGGLGKDEIIAAYDTWERIMDAILKNFAGEVSTYENEQDEYSKFLDTFLSITDPSDKETFLRDTEILLGSLDTQEGYMLELYLGNEELGEINKKILEKHREREKKLTEIFDDIKKKIEEGRYDEITRGGEGIKKEAKEIVDVLKLIDELAKVKIEEAVDAKIAEKSESIKEKAREIIDSTIILPFVQLYAGAFTEEELNELIQEAYNENLLPLIESMTKELREQLLLQENESEQNKNIIEEKKKQAIEPRIQNLKASVELSLNYELSELNALTNSELYGNQIYYLINGLNKVLDSVLLAGYVNPVTKAKLKRALGQVNRLLDIYDNYMHDRGYLIGNEYITDKDIPSDNVPMGIDGGDDYLTSPDQATLLSRIDYNTDIPGYKYLSDFLMGDDNKLAELKTKIEKALEVSDSPVLKLLDAFALDVTGLQMNFSLMFEEIENEITGKTGEIDETLKKVAAGTIDLESVIAHIDLAQKLVDLLYSVLMGARSDQGGFELNKLLSTDVPNFGFHFGINSIINEVKQKMGDNSQPFLTIEGQTTDNIVSDLHILSKKLKFYKDLYGINSGLKLSSQPKITLRTNQLIYKALRDIYKATKKLYDTAPDEIDTTMLDGFFGEGSIIALNLEKDSVDLETLEKIQAERIKLEDALYDFAHAEKNKGKKFLNHDALHELFTEESVILNETTEKLGMGGLIGYLASRMSLKSSEFYDDYRKEISDDLAPLTLQEIESYVHAANALNGDEFTAYKQQFRSEMLSYLEGLTEEQRIRLFVEQGYDDDLATLYGIDEMKPYLGLLPFVPNYDNITFVEGIAGSGKTHGVLNIVKRLLSKTAPELLENVLIATPEEKNSTDLGKELGLTKGIFKSREGLLEYISTWKLPTFNEQKQSYDYKEGLDYVIENGQIKQAYKLKSGMELPSLIIIDEIGQYTDLELMTIDAFAKEHGISVLTFGDLDLNINSGNVLLNLPNVRKKLLTRLNKDTVDRYIDKDGNISYNTYIQRGQLMHGFKLGFSMRTRSSLLDKNQAIIQAKLKKPQGDVTLHYYEGADPDSGEFVLNGAKVYNYNNNDELSTAKDQIIELVDKLIPTLKTGEKIGLIYLSKDSKLYKVLKEKYGDLIDDYLGKKAQGYEDKYFIMETSWDNKSAKSIMLELNTGVTRAMNGIIVLSKDPMQSDGILRINSVADSGTKSILLRPEEIAQFSLQLKQSFDRIFKDYSGPGLKYLKRSPIVLVNDLPPVFAVVGEIEKQGDKVIVNVVPTKITNNWLKSQRGNGVTVKQFISDKDGFNVQIVFEEENITIPISGKITDYVDVTLEEEVIIPPTSSVETHEANGNDLDVHQELHEDPHDDTGEFNRESHRETIEGKPENQRPVISLYTVSGVETGGYKLRTDSAGNPIPNKPPVLPPPPNGERFSPDRVDSMHGLIKILGKNKTYEELLEHLLNILNAIHTLNRVLLETWIKDYFKEKLNIDIAEFNLQFGLWTSSNKSMAKTYAFLERTSDERSLFNEIDDPNISRHTFSLLIKFNQKGSDVTLNLLIPIGFLTSPFTLIQEYEKADPNCYIAKKILALRAGNVYNSFNAFVVDILNDPIVYQSYPELYNLFKLYHFDYAGFFPLIKEQGAGIRFGWNSGTVVDTFSLQDFGNRGILVMQDRGMRQLNKKYQLETKGLVREFFDVREWKRDMRMRTTSKPYIFTLSGKPASVQRRNPLTGQYYNQPVLKGRPFILVSENKGFISDSQMMNAYLAGDPSVKLVYLTPPKLTLQELMKDLMDYENHNIDYFTSNDATVFHILNIIRKSEVSKAIFEERFGNLGVAKEKLINLLNRLEQALNDAPTIEVREGTRVYRRKDYSKFVSILKESDDFFGSGVNLLKLRKALRLLTSKKVFKIHEVEGDEDKRNFLFTLDPATIEAYNNALEDAGYEIYDSVKIKKDVNDLEKGVAVEIETDTNDNFTIHGGRPLLMDARVTTPTFFSSELGLFIDTIVNSYIGELLEDGTLKNTTDNNRSIEPSLIRGFERQLKELPDPGNLYKPSETYKNLSEAISGYIDLSSPVFKTPTNLAEELLYILNAIDFINNSGKVPKLAIKNDNGTVTIVDYSETGCLSKFKTGYDKRFTRVDATHFELSFSAAGSNPVLFTAELKTESGLLKLFFEELKVDDGSEGPQIQPGLKYSTPIDDPDPDSNFSIVFFDTSDFSRLLNGVETNGDNIEFTADQYIEYLINFLRNIDEKYTNDAINLLTEIATSDTQIIQQVREEIVNKYGFGIKNGNYSSETFISQLKAYMLDPNLELIPTQLNLELVDTTESQCNKFNIVI